MNLSSPTADFDLFISYGRKDDEPFVRQLVADLKILGHNPWFDKEGGMKSNGLSFLQNIRDAIAANPIRLILVIGPHSAASEYVQAEYMFALQYCITVIPILRIGRLNNAPSDADYEIIPEAVSKRRLHCIDFRTQRDYKSALDELASSLTGPPILPAPLHGVINQPGNYISRDQDIQQIKHSILADTVRPTVITSIGKATTLHGMGGIGKTVLAAAVARDCDVRRSFQDGIYWLTFGQTPNLRSIAGIFAADKNIDLDSPQGKDEFKSLIRNLNCLVILDDIWQEEVLEIFADDLAPRRRILVTTRNRQLTKQLSGSIIQIGLLSDTQSLQLLAQACAIDKKDLPPEAPLIVKECGQLPLALNMIGSMIRVDNAASWRYALETLQAAELDEIEQKFPDYPFTDLFKAIDVSLRILPDEMLTKYLQLGIFREDARIPADIISLLWKDPDAKISDEKIPEAKDPAGKIPDEKDPDSKIPDAKDAVSKDRSNRKAHKLLNEFVNRGLLQEPAPGFYALHDLLIDYISMTGQDLPATHARLVANLGAPLELKGDYAWNYYIWHLLSAGQTKIAANLLLEFEWIEARIKNGSPFALIADVQLLADKDPQFRELVTVLASCQQIIAEDPSQLRTQLMGRIIPGHPLLDRLLASVAKSAGPFVQPLFPCFENKPYGSIDKSFDNPGNSFALSGDERSLAMTTITGLITIWDWQSGKQQIHYTTPTQFRENLHIRFLPDDKRILLIDYSGYAAILHWREARLEMLSGTPFSADMYAPGKRRSFVFSDDQRYLFLNTGLQILVFDLTTAILKTTIEPGTGFLDNIHLARNGKTIFFTAEKNFSTIYAWDWIGNTESARLADQMARDNAYLLFDTLGDGRLLIRHFSTWQNCHVRQAAQKEEAFLTLAEHTPKYLAIKDNPDFFCMKGQDFERWLVWDWMHPKTPDALFTYEGAAFLPIYDFERIASIPTENIFFMKSRSAGHIDVVHPGKPEKDFSLSSGANNIGEICLSPDGKYLLTGDDEGYIDVWDHEHRRLVTRNNLLGKAIGHLYFSEGGKYCCFNSRETSHVINMISFTSMLKSDFEIISIPLVAAAFSPDRVCTTRNDDYLFFESAQSLHVKYIPAFINIDAEPGYHVVSECRLLSNSRTLASIAWQRVDFYDTLTGELKTHLTTGTRCIFNKEGNLLFSLSAEGLDRGIAIFDTENLLPDGVMPFASNDAASKFFDQLKFSANGSLLLLRNDKIVCGWDLKKRQPAFHFEKKDAGYGSIRFADVLPGNRFLLYSLYEKDVYCYDLTTKEYIWFDYKWHPKNEPFHLPIHKKCSDLVLLHSDGGIVYPDYNNDICYCDGNALTAFITGGGIPDESYPNRIRLSESPLFSKPDRILKMEWSPDQETLFTLDAGNRMDIYDWHPHTLVDSRSFPFLVNEKFPIYYGNDFVALPQTDFSILIWRWRLDQMFHLTGHKNRLRQLLFIPEHNLLASSAEDKSILIWNLSPSEPVKLYRIAVDDTCVLAFDPSRDLLIANGLKGRIYSFRIPFPNT